MATEQLTILNCQAVFSQFAPEDLRNFIKDCKIEDSRIEFKSTVLTGSDYWDKKYESFFSLKLKSKSKKERFEKIVENLAVITNLFAKFQNKIFETEKTVNFTVLNNSIFPVRFKLNHLFDVKEFSIGSTRYRIFNRTFTLNPPSDDYNIFPKFLENYHDYVTSSTIVAAAIHDRQSLTINFPDCYMKNIEVIKRVVEIEIPYSNIRRLVATLNKQKNGQIYLDLIFELFYPIRIQIFNLQKQKLKTGETIEEFNSPNRVLTWNPRLGIENSISKSHSFHIKTFVDSARNFLDFVDRIQRLTGLRIEYREFEFSKQCFKIEKYWNCEHVYSKFPKLKNSNDYFSLIYAVDALLTRGGSLYDYFFRFWNYQFENFCKKVITSYETEMDENSTYIAEKKKENNQFDENLIRPVKTILVLEEMLQQIERLIDLPDPFKMFDHFYKKQHIRDFELLEEEFKEGYVRIRRIIVTPTRRLYVTPELIMGNQAIRQTSPDCLIRIAFRDDDNKHLMHLTKNLLEKTVTNLLEAGTWDEKKIEEMKKKGIFPLIIGGKQFSFVGYSNSQLRDHGCYFHVGTEKEIREFRHKHGRFKVAPIPKMMSRLAQIFTQSRKSKVHIEWEDYCEISDIIGGQDNNDDPYTFTDGAGMLSLAYMKSIIQGMNWGDYIPSVMQFRFRGYKGILAINTEMDETLKWMNKNKIEICLEDKKKPWYACSMLLRPSQRKFHGPKDNAVQVVKISAPTEVSLNRPLINILDQNAEKQGCGNRMAETIFLALEKHIQSLIDPLVNEVEAAVTLSGLPKWIHYDKFQGCFNLTEEPFLRSLIQTIAKSDFHNRLKKLKIKIAPSKGRMMFGMPDPTGLLQYGQLFIQYTNDINMKTCNSETTIHRGKVLITKNPSVVPGDCRMLEAVDLPALHDFKDVVVFPTSGPRPHPDEMAGSDLDGDEFSVYFDPNLFLEYSEEAFDFTAPKSNFFASEPIEKIMENLTKEAAKFLSKYISLDSVGSISNAHLANSDLYGLTSDHCNKIAEKNCRALDFPKSGIEPEKLTRIWNNGKPPEKPETFPNFMGKLQKSVYKSKRLLGKLYDHVMTWSDLIDNESLIGKGEKIEIDMELLCDGWYEKFMPMAEETYKNYSTIMKSILTKYGLENDGELFTGCYISVNKKILEKDEDFSFYNVKQLINFETSKNFAYFRNDFFKKFGGIQKCADLDDISLDGVKEIFQRFCRHPTEEMQQKAMAYYKVAYKNKKFLSFAWIPNDILIYIKRKARFAPRKAINFCFNPLFEKLNKYIQQLQNSKIYFAAFLAYKDKLDQSSDKITTKIAEYCKIYQGLDQLLFFFRQWIKKHNISEVKEQEMDMFILSFGLNKTRSWWMDTTKNDEFTDLCKRMNGLGKLFWDLIQFMTTRAFGYSKSLSFSVSEIKLYFTENQCLNLHYAAINTLFPIAYNRRMTVLPGQNEDQNNIIKNSIEGPILTLEVSSTHFDCINDLEIIAKECGLDRITTRKKPAKISRKFTQISVVPVGNFESIQRFKKLLIVEPNMDEPDFEKRAQDLLKKQADKICLNQLRTKIVDDNFHVNLN